VDGNVTRVLARLLWLKGDLKAHAAQKRLWQLAQELVDPQQPGVFNQAVMELGSTVCLPKQPRCGACPVSHLCAAYQRGQPTAVPEPSRRTATQARVDVSAIILREGRYLLARRAPDGLWGGLWEFPRATRHERESLESVAQRAAAQLGVQVQPLQTLASLQHAVTTARIRLYGYLCAWLAGEAQPTGAYDAAVWVAPDALTDYPLSAPQRRLAHALTQHGGQMSLQQV
jgi:A/G-specific adenine glycosylase